MAAAAAAADEVAPDPEPELDLEPEPDDSAWLQVLGCGLDRKLSAQARWLLEFTDPDGVTRGVSYGCHTTRELLRRAGREATERDGPGAQSQTPLGVDSRSWAANIRAAALSHQRRRIALPITRAGARGQVGARGPSLGCLLALVSDLVGVRVLSAVNAGLDDMSAILLASALVHPSCTLEVLILRANGKSMPIFSSSDSLDPAAHRARVAARRAERDGPGCTR